MRKERWDNEATEELLKAVLKLRNLGEAKAFFRDLLTEKELLEFGNRWKVARMLSRGVPYLEIGRQTWMSSTTIARIQKWLKDGKGGYRKMLQKTATR
ncbi:MAG: YerC/YecD family TrpR-related protein [Patescibacteria group bacterium]